LAKPWQSSDRLSAATFVRRLARPDRLEDAKQHGTGCDGSSRTRFFVNVNTEFATAGAIGSAPGSPIPPGCSLLSTTCTSTFGASLIRITG